MPCNRAFATPTLIVAALTIAGGAGFAASELASGPDDPAALGKEIAHELRGSIMEDPAAMQRWMEAGTPGKPHEMLATSVGMWDIKMKTWMDMESPPQVSEGTAEVKPIMGGRFITETLKTEIMGMPYEGLGIFGFDNVTKQFTSAWIDNMNTSITTSQGSISPDGKTLTFIGAMNEPMSGEVGKAFMIKSHMHSADHHSMEMFEVLYGEPVKVMEIQYNRAQN